MNHTSHTWPLQEAKNRLSQLIVNAQKGNPQYITKRGQEAAVLVSIQEYKTMHKNAKPFNEFLLAVPLVADREIERVSTTLRDLQL